MKQVIAKTPGEAWVKVCKLVMEEGHEVKDEGIILKEINNLFISVTNPDKEDEILKKFANKEEKEWMRRLLLETKPIPPMGRLPAFEISYGEMIFNLNGKSQLEWVIKKLKNNPDTKSATFSLLNPGEETKISITCIPTFDFKIRDGKLSLTIFSRSQDAYKKLQFDILFIGEIERMVAKKVGVLIGSLNFFVVSEHIYEPDFDEVNNLLKQAVSLLE